MSDSMGDSDAKIKKKYRSGTVKPDPGDPLAIVIHYDVEEYMPNQDGKYVLHKKKPGQSKTVKVKSLNVNTNVPKMAAEVVKKMQKLFPKEGGQEQVETVLRSMQQRISESSQSHYNNENSALPVNTEEAVQFSQDTVKHPAQNVDAHIEDLDHYMEQLYEDEVAVKAEATLSLLALCRNPAHLEELAQHEQLIGVMSRLLREEGRKSMELSLNVVWCFYHFSHYRDFHPVILNNQVGDMILKLILLEIKRYNQRQEDISKLQDRQAVKDATDKLKKQCKKQERLLAVSFRVLLNIAEDTTIERKMKKRGIVAYLSSMLERTDLELLSVACEFLKKMSIFTENIKQMKENEVVVKLCRFVPCSNEKLSLMMLGLMLNLSFDSEARENMVNQGMIPKLVELLKKPTYRPAVLRLLYHFSTDDQCKSIFICTDCIPLMLQLLLNYPENYSGPDKGGKELLALAVNLATNSRCAQMMCDGDGMNLLFRRLFKTMDSVLMKVIRNCSAHDGSSKNAFQEYVNDLVRLAKQTANPDLLVEVLGTLGNLTGIGVDFAQIIEEQRLIDFFEQHLQPDHVEDDILLEVIVFIGTVCNDNAAAVGPIIANSNLIVTLTHLLTEKQEDDEIVLQVLYVFYRLVVNESTREVLLRQTDAVSHIIDLLADNNMEIRKMADQALELIMEMDDELGKRIRHRKFVVHNQTWWQMATGGYEEQLDHSQMQEEHQYQAGPYQGYGDSEGEDDEMGMMGMMEDGDYSMDAYGDTGYLAQGFGHDGQQYYGDDSDI